MNGSLRHLLEGMIAVVDQQIIPRIDDDFARGQAYGVSYMLRCLVKSTEWSSVLLGRELASAAQASVEFHALLEPVKGKPDLDVIDPQSLPRESAEAVALLARANRQICEVFEWLEAHRAELSEDLLRASHDIFQRYVTRQLKTQLSAGVPINFSEISTGHAYAERTKP